MIFFQAFKEIVECSAEMLFALNILFLFAYPSQAACPMYLCQVMMDPEKGDRKCNMFWPIVAGFQEPRAILFYSPAIKKPAFSLHLPMIAFVNF
jgi:hypothetical protein